MRIIITCLFLLCIIFSCQNAKDHKYKVKQAALESGVKVDSIFCGLTFNDSPMEVIHKLNFLYDNKTLFLDTYDYKLKYRFSYPEFLNNIEWVIDRSNISFYNDSLYNFTLEAKDLFSSQYDDCLIYLDSLYSNKYGTPIRENEGKTLNWFKGNLNICISMTEFESPIINDIICISYINEEKSLHYYTADKILKPNNNDYSFNLHYSNYFWNKHYYKKNQNLIDKASEDI